MTIGLYVWPSFHLVDHYLGRVVYPGAPLLFFFVLRILGELAIYAMYRLSFRESISSTQLKVANALVCGFAALLIAIMAVWFGDLSSPYLHGTALVILVLALAVPAPWRDTLIYAGACALSHPVVMVIASQFRPKLAASFHDPSQVALFFGHYSILLGFLIISLVTSQATFNARQQLRKARRLGRYRLEARIGEGGMNEVWLAQDPALKRNVALKILHSNPDTDPKILARFEREALALSRLASPYTVRIFDFAASEDGFSFIAMEHLGGRDVQATITADGPFEADRAARLGVQVCRSLREAHETGIIHRDVKPANIFVTASIEGRELVKVLDFGIARLVASESDATKTQSMRGTPAYMAPECWTGTAADARSDIYSLGATLYFMVVGRPPFEGADLVRAHLLEPPEPPSAALGKPVPRELESIILRCLAKSPAARFEDVETLEHALADWLDELARLAQCD